MTGATLELHFKQNTNWLYGEKKEAATSLLVLPFPQETL